MTIIQLDTFNWNIIQHSTNININTVIWSDSYSRQCTWIHKDRAKGNGTGS